MIRICINLFSGGGTPMIYPLQQVNQRVLPPSDSHVLKKETPILLHITSFVWYLIILCSQNSKKPLFRGWYSLIYPFRGSDPMCDFNIFKLHQNEDLCKKLEDSILKNMDRILKKPFFRGWYPLIYPLQGV